MIQHPTIIIDIIFKSLLFKAVREPTKSLNSKTIKLLNRQTEIIKNKNSGMLSRLVQRQSIGPALKINSLGKDACDK